MMNVAVYMGSFNPMHVGHIAVIRYLLEKGGFDRVLLVVSPQNPFKDKSLADSASLRYRNACKVIAGCGLDDRVKVDDIELSMGYPSWSIRTLDALASRDKSDSFTLVVGGDNLHELLEWREGERILTQYGVVVYPREGYDIQHDAEILRLRHGDGEKTSPFRIKLLCDAPLVNVSSTEIREMMSKGLDVSKLLA